MNCRVHHQGSRELFGDLSFNSLFAFAFAFALDNRQFNIHGIELQDPVLRAAGPSLELR